MYRSYVEWNIGISTGIAGRYYICCIYIDNDKLTNEGTEKYNNYVMVF